MAIRFVVAKFPRQSLFKSIYKVPLEKTGSIRHGSMFPDPPVPWLEKPSVIFSAKALKHHWGALPVIIISMLGVTLELLAIMRLAVTRDDVWYTRGPAACETVETRKGYKVPIRKFLVVGQKYENPPGLIEALQGDTSGPAFDNSKDNDKAEKGDNEKSGRSGGMTAAIIAANAVLAAGVIYMAMVI